MDSIKSLFSTLVQQILADTQKDIRFISGLVVGLLLAAGYHYLFGQRQVRKAHEKLLQSKDDQIDDLKHLVHDRLRKVDVQKVDDAGIIKKLKKYFSKQKR